ncbi:hypothetical protein AB0H37_38150 [Actinomadura sp. NPDC023710]|uniref:hypothetical protein n=1 Tax=Actinomadura sp. NPDC023710 TaxID=3158219 RepID=UPI0033E21922
MAMATRHKVGTPFVAGRTAWPEIPMLQVREAVAEVRLFVAGPAGDLVNAVDSGTLRAGWIGSEAGALLCVSLLADDRVVLPWISMPYHVRNDVHDQLGPVEIGSPKANFAVMLLLVDAATGLVAAVARHMLPPSAAEAVRATLSRQLDSGTPAAGAAVAMRSLRSEYGSDAGGVEAMLRDHRAVTWESRPA